MATKHCRCRQNVADAINVLNVFVTHVHPIRFPNETNFRALIARQGRTNERTNERANQMNEGIFEFVIIARTHTHAYHPTHTFAARLTTSIIIMQTLKSKSFCAQQK